MRLEEIARAKALDGDTIELWLADEARAGRKNKLTGRWAKRGTRPSAPRDQRTASTYIFGALCPKRGKGAALILPACNTEAMNLHLAEIAAAIAPAAHAVLLVDQAGWHMSTPHAAQHLHLFGCGRQDRLLRSGDPDATGGAAPAAAAHGGVRDAGHPARLQYRHAAHDLDHAAVRIGQADDAAPALPVPTHEPRGQHSKERPHEGVTHPHHHLIDDRGVRWCCAWVILRELGNPGRILRHRHNLPTALEETEDRQGRHQ